MTADLISAAASHAEMRDAHVATWDAVAQEVLADRLGEAYDALIDRMPPKPGGDSWLDVATGTGPLALRAARAGANVSAFDFAAQPLDTARQRAAAEGLKLVIEQRALDHHRYVPEEFSAVVSAFGAMYALDHQQAASALSMLTHPAGRIGLVAWTPASLPARAFELIQPYTPLGWAQDPFLWGDPAYIDELFGEFWSLKHAALDISLGGLSADEVWRLFLEADGPTAAAAQSLDPQEREDLARRFTDAVDEYRSTDGRVTLSLLVSVGHHPGG
jgi:hypothetical protein